MPVVVPKVSKKTSIIQKHKKERSISQTSLNSNDEAILGANSKDQIRNEIL